MLYYERKNSVIKYHIHIKNQASQYQITFRRPRGSPERDPALFRIIITVSQNHYIQIPKYFPKFIFNYKTG
jgi:hypothetical protein